MAESTVDTRFKGLTDCFVTEEYATIFPDGTAIKHGATKSGTVTVNKAGYYPLGILSYWFINSTTGGKNNGTLLLSRLYLSSQASGTCDVAYYCRNISESGDANIRFVVKILWVKE